MESCSDDRGQEENERCSGTHDGFCHPCRDRLFWRAHALVRSGANPRSPSQLVLWIPLLGVFTGLLAAKTGLVIMAAAWGVMMLFNLVTLPVEFDASRRARLLLGQMGFIHAGPERSAVAQVLNAAAWTYVAAFVTSMIYFLWHLVPLVTGRDRD